MSYSPMKLAEVFIKTGELTDALDALNQQLEDMPDDTRARRMRAAVLLRLGEIEQLHQAIYDLDTLEQPTAEDHLQRSIIYERMGNSANAIHALESARNTAPDDERMIERHVELLIADHQYETAIETIKQAPDTWRWRQREGDVHRLMNQLPEALHCYQSATDDLLQKFTEPLSPHAQNYLARLLIGCAQTQHALGEYAPASENYTKALQYLPDDPSILFNLGLIAADKGDISSAQQQCQNALELASPYIRQLLIDILQIEKYAPLKSALNI